MKDWITESYRDVKNLLRIKQAFRENIPKSIQLQEVFKEKKYEDVQEQLEMTTFDDEYAPDTHSYSIAELPEELEEFVTSPEFTAFLTFITEKNGNVQWEIQAFRTGDYTLLGDEEEGSYLDCLFCCTDDWKQEYGGFISYVQENQEVLRVVPKRNSLTVVHLQKGIKGFIKYVNVKAPGSLYLIRAKIR